MKRIADVGNLPLVWTQPGKGRDYRLLAGQEPVASLRWDNTGGQEAIAETADGAWSFRRSGLLRPTIRVQTRDGASDAATMTIEWTGGLLKLQNGTEYRWGAANFWRTEWAFAKAGESATVHFRPEGKKVELGADAAAREETPLLLVTGWYLLVLMLDDAAIIGL
jgi:hypothetical protein